MASMITLKRRINSIRSTKQITKAMQMVSASKLRRAQDYASQSREYQNLAYQMLGNLAVITELRKEPLFATRKITSKLYVVITSNSGLAGAYNNNVLKAFNKSLKIDQQNSTRSQVIMIGNKGAQFVRRLKDVELLAVYNSFKDQPSANDIRPILNTIMKMFKEQQVDQVELYYTFSRTNIAQETKVLQLLPVTKEETLLSPDKNYQVITNFEPNIETIIDQIVTRLVEAQLWQALLESLAAEHAMRMIAMKNATDNANDLIEDYTLEFNTARQAGITQEIAEITGGSEAMNE